MGQENGEVLLVEGLSMAVRGACTARRKMSNMYHCRLRACTLLVRYVACWGYGAREAVEMLQDAWTTVYR